MFTRLVRVLADPIPARFLLLRFLDRRLGFLNYRWKLNVGAVERPDYGYCLLSAAVLAKKLGYSHISAIEFGVAGGSGLLALEDHAERVGKETGVRVSVFGFDTGHGMPPPRDYRDMPYLWEAGYYTMDRGKLEAKLRFAELVIGSVGETVPVFCKARNPPPIGFISFDLDYYSSTVEALKIFDSGLQYFLPRVACYMDDIVGDIERGYNEFCGVRLAIAEYNSAHGDRKIAATRGLRFFGPRIPRLWHEQIFVAHLFEHVDYGRPVHEVTQLSLDPGAQDNAAWNRV